MCCKSSTVICITFFKKFYAKEISLDFTLVNGSCRYLRKNNKQTKTISFPINKRELTENARLEIDLFKESPIFGKTKIGHEAIEITRMNGFKIAYLKKMNNNCF